MRAIAKGTEPRSLRQHRAAGGDYDGYSAKDDLRQTLMVEQRGLCCYCMGRIRLGFRLMKIEHWRSLSRYPDMQLQHGNLLAACMGGEGDPAQLQHCDTKKGNEDLRWNPANPLHAIEQRFGYRNNGEIYAIDRDGNEEIENVLNLNLPKIRNNRKAILQGLLDWWTQEEERLRGRLSRDRILRKRNEYVTDNGSLEPYCQVAVWWLDQKLKGMVP